METKLAETAMESGDRELQYRIERAVKDIDEIRSQNAEVTFINDPDELEDSDVDLILYLTIKMKNNEVAGDVTVIKSNMNGNATISIGNSGQGLVMKCQSTFYQFVILDFNEVASLEPPTEKELSKSLPILMAENQEKLEDNTQAESWIVKNETSAEFVNGDTDAYNDDAVKNSNIIQNEENVVKG